MLKTQDNSVNINTKFAKKLRIAIIRTDYHKELNDNLETYCKDTLSANGVESENIKSFNVPGSWEIPMLAQKLTKSKKFDAIICFGVIVKGDTYHFEMLANEVEHALMKISLNYDIPIIMEILAVFKKEDAEKRAGKNEFNKGIEAAVAALKILKVLKNE